MPKLINCLAKAAKLISTEEKAQIVAKSDEYRAMGMDEDSAEQKAVYEYATQKHKALNDQLNDLRQKAGAAHVALSEPKEEIKPASELRPFNETEKAKFAALFSEDEQEGQYQPIEAEEAPEVVPESIFQDAGVLESTPEPTEYKTGDKVIYQGKEVMVVDVNQMKSGNTYLTLSDGTPRGEKIVSASDVEKVEVQQEQQAPTERYLPFDESTLPSDRQIEKQIHEVKPGDKATFNGRPVLVVKIEKKAAAAKLVLEQEGTVSAAESYNRATIQSLDGKPFIATNTEEGKTTSDTLEVYAESLQPYVEPEDNTLITMVGLKHLLNNLQQRFGIPYKLVVDEGDWKGRFVDGTVYINTSTVDRTTPFHEYLHPFIAALAIDNPEVYKGLVGELATLAKTDPGVQQIFKQIEESPIYSGRNDQDKLNEAIVRYISALSAKNVNQKGQRVTVSITDRLADFVKRFVKWLSNIWTSYGSERGGTGLKPVWLSKFTQSEIQADQNLKKDDPNKKYLVSFPEEVSLQDIADMVSLTDVAFDLSAHAELLKTLDELQDDSYVDDWVKAKLKRLRGRLDTLKDTANRRLRSESLGKDVAFASRALSDDNDVRALTNFVDTGIRSLNWANGTFTDLTKKIKGEEPLSKDDINQIAKDLEVVKNISSYYLTDVRDIISTLGKEFSREEKDDFNDILVRADRVVDQMRNRSIDILTEWMWPSVENLNERLAADHPDAVTTKEKFRNMLYQADTDIDRAFFLLGSVGSSKDLVSATVRDLLFDVVESNKFFDANLSATIKNVYEKWLHTNGLKNERKDIGEHFKKHFLRKATQLEVVDYKPDPEDPDGKRKLPVYGYVERWAFHQPYFYDLWRKESDAYAESLGERPSFYENPKKYNEWEEKVRKWQEVNGTINQPADRFINPEFEKIHGKDELFTTLYDAYMSGNQGMVEDEQLNFGILPQVSLGKNLFSDLGKTTAKGALGKVLNAPKAIWDFMLPKADEKSYAGYEENLDGSSHRSIRVPYNRMLNESDLDLALPETILKFGVSRNLTKLMREIEPNVRILKSTLEGVPSLKIQAREVLKTGAKGNLFWHKFGRKLPVKKEGLQALVNKQLATFINHAFYGEGEIPSFLELGPRTVDLNKWGGNMAFLTALNNMVGNVTAGISNVAIGNVQSFGEAVGGKYYKPEHWRSAAGEYTKSIPEFIADASRLKKGILTQIAIHYDAIQGEFRDKYGKRFVGNVAQKYATSDTLFILTHAGEHQIQIQGMLALMKATPVKLTGGTETNLRDAYQLNEKGFLKIREDAIWSDQDEHNFTKKLHGLNQLLNGNYSSFDKSYAQHTWMGKLALIYRKYLYNGFRMRFGSKRVDMQLGDVVQGYYSQFFKKLGSDIKDYKLQLLSKDARQGWSGDEKYAAAKTLYELSLLVGLSIAGIALAGGQGKPNDEPWLKSYLALLMVRLKQDVGTYTIFGPTTMFQIIQSPSAIAGTLTRYSQFFKQLVTDPFETYKRKTGYFDKGESILKAKLYKSIPVLRQFVNLMQPEEQKQFYNLLNKNF